MEAKSSLIIFVSAIALVMGTASAYVTQVHAPAVLSNEESGVLTLISLNVTPGNGAVVIAGPSSVGLDTLASAKTAAAYASYYQGVNESRYNFTYRIKDGSSNVSGPSAGLAFTLLAIEGLRQQQLYSNFTVTGTIGPNGNVGEVGGVYNKLGAAKASGIQYAVVPFALSSDPEYLIYYITQQTFNIPVIMVANASEALPYAVQPAPALVKPFTFNLSRNYYLGGLPQANVSCGNCSRSYFGQLVNFTFNTTESLAATIKGNFTPAQGSLIRNIGTYKEIASKGYLYAAADLAFLQFSDVYTLASAANRKNLSTVTGQNIIDNISSYCSVITPPQLTGSNYEYVIGGELRQQWAKTNLEAAQELLNASNTTDDIIYAIYTAAPSEAWCASSREMYNIANEIGGNPVALSPQVKADALSAITSVKSTGTGSIYSISAGNAYNQSQYATALYSAVYAQTFGATPPANATASQLSAMTAANAANSTFGIWPSQFASTALFNLYEAKTTGGNELANITAAYTESELALNLAKANEMISSQFVPANTTIMANSSVTSMIENQTAQIGNINQEVSQIYSILLALTLIMAVIAIILIFLLLRIKAEPAPPSNGKGRKGKGS